MLESLKVSSIDSTIEPLKEADLSRHLENGNKKKSGNSKDKSKDKGDESESLAQTDYQLYEALNMLKGLAILQQSM